MRLKYGASESCYVLRNALRRNKDQGQNHMTVVVADMKRRSPTAAELPPDVNAFDDAAVWASQAREFGYSSKCIKLACQRRLKKDDFPSTPLPSPPVFSSFYDCLHLFDRLHRLSSPNVVSLLLAVPDARSFSSSASIACFLSSHRSCFAGHLSPPTARDFGPPKSLQSVVRRRGASVDGEHRWSCLGRKPLGPRGGAGERAQQRVGGFQSRRF